MLTGRRPDVNNINVIHMDHVGSRGCHRELRRFSPASQAAIGAAMPILTGEFTRQELAVVGGLGVSA